MYNSCNFFFNSFLPSKGHFFKKRSEQIGPISNQETIILLLYIVRKNCFRLLWEYCTYTESEFICP
jgi:hypothetical protein